METTKSKAAQKREKQFREALTSLIGAKLKGFENKYMSAYTEWEMSEIKKQAEKYPNLKTRDDFWNEFSKKTFLEAGLVNEWDRRANVIVDANSLFYSKKDAIDKLELDSLTRFKFMSDAAKGYKAKLERLIQKLIDFEFEHRFLKVESVRTNAGELEILIKNETRTCHARLIWAEGATNAPHYRFITTVRKN